MAMVKFKFDFDYVIYIILLFIISFLCYRVYTLNEKAETHYLEFCEYENANKYNVIFYDQTIASLKKTNKELYDSIKHYKDEIDYLLQLKAEKEYIFDTVYIKNIIEEEKAKEQVFEYKNEENDTLNYKLTIGSLYEPNWYQLQLMISDEFTIVNRRFDDESKNITEIFSSNGSTITDVTAFKPKEKETFFSNFVFGPSINFGYDIMNKNFGVNVGFSITYNLNKKK